MSTQFYLVTWKQNKKLVCTPKVVNHFQKLSNWAVSQCGEETICYSPKAVKEAAEHTKDWLRYICITQGILSGKRKHILLCHMGMLDWVQKQNNRMSKAQCPSKEQFSVVWQQFELLIHPHRQSMDINLSNLAWLVLQQHTAVPMHWSFTALHGVSAIRIFVGGH